MTGYIVWEPSLSFPYTYINWLFVYLFYFKRHFQCPTFSSHSKFSKFKAARSKMQHFWLQFLIWQIRIKCSQLITLKNWSYIYHSVRVRQVHSISRTYGAQCFFHISRTLFGAIILFIVRATLFHVQLSVCHIIVELRMDFLLNALVKEQVQNKKT